MWDYVSKEICIVHLDRPCKTALHKRYYQSEIPLSMYKGACSSTASLIERAIKCLDFGNFYVGHGISALFNLHFFYFERS